ncbi:MAG: 2-C-methyl-D-erythritol 4-phosphate cytidylyltransferase [Gammaproteobacteria bacterium]|nr:2-C-methyl-D-erythritol 4-phosphate cytidylyltransferase [Gammaproteobacteria bacterium]
MTQKLPLYGVVPAAGIGSRMAATIPKQYLTIAGKTIIELSLEPLISHDEIDKIVVAINKHDQWFEQLAIASHPKIITVIGGGERADSVLAGLNELPPQGRVLVHDAARPCLTVEDLDLLINSQQAGKGVILANIVRDTMKRGTTNGTIEHTVDRDLLFHALTPQLFDLKALRTTLAQALSQQVTITDEASAMEWAGFPVKLAIGRSDNIKVTRPEDLNLAQLFLTQQQRIK